MTITLIPLAVAIVGLLMFALSGTNAKVQTIGDRMFFAGLLATLIVAPHAAMTLRLSQAGHTSPTPQNTEG